MKVLSANTRKKNKTWNGMQERNGLKRKLIDARPAEENDTLNQYSIDQKESKERRKAGNLKPGRSSHSGH